MTLLLRRQTAPDDDMPRVLSAMPKKINTCFREMLELCIMYQFWKHNVLLGSQ